MTKEINAIAVRENKQNEVSIASQANASNRRKIVIVDKDTQYRLKPIVHQEHSLDKPSKERESNLDSSL